MVEFNEAFTHGVRNAFCQALPRVVAGGLLFTALTAETGVGAVAGLATAGGAAALYAAGCNRELPPEALPAPPFSGGQCPGATYRVAIAYNFVYDGGVSGAPINQPRTGIGDVVGAVSGAVQTSSADSISVVVRGQTAATVDTLSGITAPDQGKFHFNNIRVTGIVRIDGGVDNCGNLPPVPPTIPPGSNTVNSPVTYTNTDGDTITNNYGFTFGYAQVNLNGNLQIPVSVNVNANPNINFTGNFDLKTGDFNVNLGDPSNPSATDGGCNSDPANPVDVPNLPTSLPPSDPLPPGTTDKPERRKILRGAMVTTTTIDDNRGIIFQSANPDIYVPDLGFIQFLCQVGNFTAWTTNIKVNNVRQIIECPWVAGAISVRGTPRPGVEFAVTPIYTQLSFPSQYPPES